MKEIGDGDKILNIKVDIDVRKANDSLIQGIFIKNLSLGGLSGQEAFNRLILDPLNILYQKGIRDKITILIDSLDEALAYSGGKNIVGILSELQDLPPNVRFICTTRSVRLVLSYFELLKPHQYTLATKSEANIKDLSRYIKTRTSVTQIKEKLQVIGVQLESFDLHIQKLADGNFLVAHHILNEIEASRLEISSLSDALKGFDGIYQNFLRRFCQDEWDKNYQPILGVLSIAYEALTEEQLRNLLSSSDDYRINSTKLRRSLGILLQYLEAEQKFGSETYKLHHAALREYLLDEKRNQDFWCDAKDFHYLVSSFYQSFMTTLNTSSSERIDTYGLRHLTKHLIEITSWDNLIDLLSQQTKDGKNAWFKTKNAVGEPAGFLDDIELFIQNFPRELSPKEFKALINVDELNYQVELIIKLASRYPDSLLVEALNFAIGSTDDHHKKRLLVSLVDKFSPGLLPKALEVALAIQDVTPRAKALTALADRLPEALPKALEATLDIEDESYRAQVLIELVDKLPPELLRVVLEVTLDIRDEFHGAQILMALASKLPSDLLPLALEVAHSPKYKFSRDQILVALANQLPPDLLPVALEVIQAIEDEFHRAQALTMLADRLPEVLPIALKTALAIQFTPNRAQALIALANKIPEVLPVALQTAQTIEDEFYRAQALTALIAKFPDVLPVTLQAAQAIENEYYRTQILISIARSLPEELSEDIKQTISNVIQAIQDESYKATVRDEFASFIPVITGE
ncbi:hypothetical protein NIES30_25535 [Phormidium tenue NIES-30]|uniref:TANC1/2-like winged helix domain-containing protein n=1 Tax=Phormidium tenue NIES-30 TaxID=549789 RepID=A0A1U7IY12_9CYAN|nr:hypothetical protein NIES30_25535 [Phormidium tenue NIES-30]